MDKASSVIAAIDAGKLPSQHQVNVIIDWALRNLVGPLEKGEITKLSKQGQALSSDLHKVLVASKHLGVNKNNDSLVQEMLWHLQEGNMSNISLEAMDVEEATADLDAFRSSVRTLIKILWSNIMGEGGVLLNDFASFTRLAIADVVEFAESQAVSAKDTLREFDTQVQQGERDNLGRRKKTQEEEEQEAAEDAKAKFEKTMQTVKETGSTVIGTVQSAQAKAQDTTQKASSRIREAFFKMIEGAQRDPEYKRALSTLFNTLSKWANRAADTVADVEQPLTLETFVEDPTKEKHLYHALYHLRTIIERLAGGRSLNNLFAQLRLCASGVKQDDDLNSWFKDFFAYVRESLQTPGHATLARQGYDHFSQRWQALLDEDSDTARKWKEDVKALRRELGTLHQAIRKDRDIVALRMAHGQLVRDMEQIGTAAGKVGAHFALEQGSWFWEDVFNVYAPRIMRLLRDIPIPRTEYVNHEVEFVLENLQISSFSLLPGHVYIRNITDVDIDAPSSQTTKSAWATLTHIQLKAIQLRLGEVSFYYHDKVSTVGPKELKGILVFKVPEQGLDIDFTFRLIPNTEAGKKERERCRRFFKVDAVKARLSEDIKLEVAQSNHPVIASVFKPILITRVRHAFEGAIEEQIRAAFDAVDGTAFDVSKRAEVFEDAGLGRGAAITAAIWSEIGRMRRMEGGLLHGWTATGTGIIKEGLSGDVKIAMGAEPQILPGEKRGPRGTFAEPLGERAEGVSAGEVAARVKESAEEGAKEVQSFEETVRQKTLHEKERVGWVSEAFDFDTGAKA